MVCLDAIRLDHVIAVTFLFAFGNTNESRVNDLGIVLYRIVETARFFLSVNRNV